MEAPRTMVTICTTYNARTLASESLIEDLLMQSRMIRYDVISLAKTRRRHPFNAACDTGEELFLGTCDSRGVSGVGVLVNTSLSMNIDTFEQLTTRIGRLRLKRCGSTPALTIFVVHASTSNYDEEEVEAFYMDLERFYREDHTFFKVIILDFNAKIGPRRSSEERHIGTHGLEWNEQVTALRTAQASRVRCRKLTTRLVSERLSPDSPSRNALAKQSQSAREG
uniref:Endonuclease/exonuclease/phosphatase domain-containing protein n=1 Tax=Angiostrongylus cantonensis TaxID=6313 RepID=A0A0K0DLF9_ANGCA